MGWRTLGCLWILLLVLSPVTATAEVTRAVVAVDGMSRPFCALPSSRLNIVNPAP